MKTPHVIIATLFSCVATASAQYQTNPGVICYPLEGDFICVGGSKQSGGGTPLPVHPDPAHVALADGVADAAETLISQLGGPAVGGIMELGEMTATYDSVSMRAVGSASLSVDGVEVAAGFARLRIDRNTGTNQLQLTLIEDQVERTLTLTTTLSNGEISTFGSLSVNNGTLLIGGFGYAPDMGAWDDPESDAEFAEAVMAMLHVPPGNIAAASRNAAFITISSVLSMTMNYVLDLFIPYMPPDECQGPQIQDGAGQSCNGVDIPCETILADLCEGLDDMPASTAFKKCMKGRCGCGGSHFPRAKISCDDSSSCGPCPPRTGVLVVGCNYGCNYGGSTESFYCDTDPGSCQCAEVIFHEISHACGARDERGYGASQIECPAEDFRDHSGAARIGLWFKDQCCGLPDGQ